MIAYPTQTNIAYIKATYDSECYSYMYSGLLMDEKNYLNRYRNYKDRYTSLLGLYLSKVLAGVGNDIPLYHNLQGKPYLYKQDIYISISHSQEYVAVALSKDAIGVDIERYLDLEYFDPSLFLSDIELSTVGNNRKAISLLWSFKESYLKQQGTGFQTDPKTISLMSDKGVYEAPSNGLHLYQMEPREGMLLTLCTTDLNPEVTRLTEAELFAMHKVKKQVG